MEVKKKRNRGKAFEENQPALHCQRGQEEFNNERVTECVGGVTGVTSLHYQGAKGIAGD